MALGLLSIAEDCAGLGTSSFALQQLVERKYKDVKIKHLYYSEENDSLRELLAKTFKPKILFKYAGQRKFSRKQSKLVRDCDFYVNGFPCQPYSKAGSNEGLKDKKKRTSPMKKGIVFVKRNSPKVFIFECVKNFTSKTHVKVKNKFMAKLRAIRLTRHTASGEHRYHIKEMVLRTDEIGDNIPQARERWYCVGLRSDVRAFRRFMFPIQIPVKQTGKINALDRLLNLKTKTFKTSGQQPRTHTEKRNWTACKAAFKEEKVFANKDATLVADLHQSEAFKHHFLLNACPTVTKTRASGNAFWLVKLIDGKLVRRPIHTDEYLKVQAWPTHLAKQLMASGLDERELREAAGNGFSFNVIERLLEDCTDLLMEHAKHEIAADNVIEHEDNVEEL